MFHFKWYENKYQGHQSPVYLQSCLHAFSYVPWYFWHKIQIVWLVFIVHVYGNHGRRHALFLWGTISCIFVLRFTFAVLCHSVLCVFMSVWLFQQAKFISIQNFKKKANLHCTLILVAHWTSCIPNTEISRWLLFHWK